MFKKLAQTNGILSKLRHYVPQMICISVCFSLFYSFVLHGSLARQFTSKANLNRDLTDHSNPLFYHLELLKLHDVLRSEIINFF